MVLGTTINDKPQTVPNMFDKYGNILLNHGLEFLKKEEVKMHLREQYRALVKIIFSEINIYVYIILLLVFFIL